MSKLDSRRHSGAIKWFDYINGFGSVERGIKEVYVHWTSIAMENRSTLSMCVFRGRFVEYDVIETVTGIQAANVTDIGGAPLRDTLFQSDGSSELCVNQYIAQSYYFLLNANIDDRVLQGVNAYRPRYVHLFQNRSVNEKAHRLSKNANRDKRSDDLKVCKKLFNGNCCPKSADISGENVELEYSSSTSGDSGINESVCDEILYTDLNFQRELINDQLNVKNGNTANKSLYHRWLKGYHSLCHIQNMHTTAGECSDGEMSAFVDNAVDFLELDKLFKKLSVQEVCESYKKWTE